LDHDEVRREPRPSNAISPRNHHLAARNHQVRLEYQVTSSPTSPSCRSVVADEFVAADTTTTRGAVISQSAGLGCVPGSVLAPGFQLVADLPPHAWGEHGVARFQEPPHGVRIPNHQLAKRPRQCPHDHVVAVGSQSLADVEGAVGVAGPAS
jgi:hypothetical protein